MVTTTVIQPEDCVIELPLPASTPREDDHAQD